MLLTTQHICVPTGTASKGNLGELKQTINAGPFLLHPEQLLFIKICGISLDTCARFGFHSSIGEFRAVQHDGERGQRWFPGDWKRSAAVSAFFNGMVCPWGSILLGVRRLSALGFCIGPFGSLELSAPRQTCPPRPRAAANSSTPPTANTPSPTRPTPA